MKTQCLYGLNGQTPPSPLICDHKNPIGRKIFIGENIMLPLCDDVVFFLNINNLFFRKEGGEGGKPTYIVGIEKLAGGVLGVVGRGCSWN